MVFLAVGIMLFFYIREWNEARVNEIQVEERLTEASQDMAQLDTFEIEMTQNSIAEGRGHHFVEFRTEKRM